MLAIKASAASISFSEHRRVSLCKIGRQLGGLGYDLCHILPRHRAHIEAHFLGIGEILWIFVRPQESVTQDADEIWGHVWRSGKRPGNFERELQEIEDRLLV